MLTKAIIQSIDYTENICRVRIPLFENASRNTVMIEADAQFSIVPGVYNSYKTGDVVFISFEENRMELPVILGKLFVSASAEASSHRGNLGGNSLIITDTAQLPYSTVFDYSSISRNNKLYNNLDTPKKLADSIITLQQAQIQKYQTVIKVSANKNSQDLQSDKKIYNLYLKTSSDFTYFPGKSDEPLYRLYTALKKSQAANIFIPLDMAIAEDNLVSHALLQIADLTSTEILLKVLIGEELYTVTKAGIQSIQSSAIYY